MGNQWHFDPDTYLAMVRSEIVDYDELQATLAGLTRDVPAQRILDLGSGTGVTAQRVLAEHRDAALVGIDASDEMLRHARELLPHADFRVADLTDPLPSGPFDVVVSAFAVHHLDGPGKADLFARVAAVLAPDGRFVLCDVVVPTEAVAQPVPLDPGIDIPSRVDELLGWLADAGLRAHTALLRGDRAILVADRTGGDRGAQA